MKKLICAKEIEAFADQGKKTVEIDTNTIVTPAAQDAAAELGISFTKASENKKSLINSDTSCSDIDSDLVYQVLKAMMDRGMLTEYLHPPYQCEKDRSGLMIFYENTVQYEQDGQSYSREVFCQQNSKRKAGYFKMEETSLTRESEQDEIVLILEGNIEVCVNGNKYTAKEEDMLYIPKHTKAAWSTKGKAKMFYLAYES